ncbi:hypothetical protein V6N11_034378 [Hibiscus sabdariffa]|uniref:Uncharacterized protein n=1 Tax=Hibiscus sabdariffa TaxID=183260 RepID=A0ABR2NAZ4_9ROSI
MSAVRLEVVGNGSRLGGFSMGDGGVGWFDRNGSRGNDGCRRIWVVKIMSFWNGLWLWRLVTMGSDSWDARLELVKVRKHDWFM